jgi:hydroxypyruvate isomerase
VNHPSVRLQLDQYHAAMAGEDAIACLRKYFPPVADIQIADVPGSTNQAPDRSPSARFSAKWIA